MPVNTTDYQSEAGTHVGSFNTVNIQISKNRLKHASILFLIIPVDEPLPAPAPVFKEMPPSSPKFVGYEDYLHMLEEHFVTKSAYGQPRPTFVLFGVGGVGKTQICLRFAESISNKYVMIALSFRNQIEDISTII